MLRRASLTLRMPGFGTWHPALMKVITLAPAERTDAVVDFAISPANSVNTRRLTLDNNLR
jgi:hypothetical protein